MTIREAKDIIDRYELKSVMTPDEEFLLTEAFNCIIEETKDTRYMVRLGERISKVENESRGHVQKWVLH